MTTSGIRATEHPVRRLDVALPLPYDRAVRRYEELVPAADLARFGQLATWDAVLELAEINAPHGFMIYWRADVTAMMAGSPSGWKCTEYLMGNHTIAERMFRHNPTAMLYAPLRTVISQAPGGPTLFSTEQPSRQFSSLGNPDIAAVGIELDHKLAGLLDALHLPVPPCLTT